MRVYELIETGIVTLDDIKDYINSGDSEKSVRDVMNELTGFEASYLDLRLLEDDDEYYSDEEILDAKIIDNGWFFK